MTILSNKKFSNNLKITLTAELSDIAIGLQAVMSAPDHANLLSILDIDDVMMGTFETVAGVVEIIGITTDDDITVSAFRSQESTTAVTWPIDSVLSIRLTAGVLTDMITVADTLETEDATINTRIDNYADTILVTGGEIVINQNDNVVTL